VSHPLSAASVPEMRSCEGQPPSGLRCDGVAHSPPHGSFVKTPGLASSHCPPASLWADVWLRAERRTESVLHQDSRISSRISTVRSAARACRSSTVALAAFSRKSKIAAWQPLTRRLQARWRAFSSAASLFVRASGRTREHMGIPFRGRAEASGSSGSVDRHMDEPPIIAVRYHDLSPH